MIGKYAFSLKESTRPYTLMWKCSRRNCNNVNIVLSVFQLSIWSKVFWKKNMIEWSSAVTTVLDSHITSCLPLNKHELSCVTDSQYRLGAWSAPWMIEKNYWPDQSQLLHKERKGVKNKYVYQPMCIRALHEGII